MELLTQSLVWFQNNIEVIGGYAGLGAALAFIVQTLKVKWRLDERVLRFTKNIKLDGPKLVNLLLSGLTAVPFVADLLVQHFTDNPGLQTGNYAWLFVASVWLHRFAVSPLFAKAQKNLEAKKQEQADAEAYRQLVAAQKQAAMPTTPTEPVTPTAGSDRGYDPTLTIQG